MILLSANVLIRIPSFIRLHTRNWENIFSGKGDVVKQQNLRNLDLYNLKRFVTRYRINPIFDFKMKSRFYFYAVVVFFFPPLPAHIKISYKLTIEHSNV